jgi:hypothetical protein
VVKPPDIERIVHPLAITAGDDQTDVPQALEMMGGEILRQAQRLMDIADTTLTLLEEA